MVIDFEKDRNIVCGVEYKFSSRNKNKKKEMRKTLLALFAVATLALVSCNGGSTEANVSSDSATVAVDTTAIDTTTIVADTTSVDTTATK